MAVQAQETPNPNAMKFTTDQGAIFTGDGSVSVMPGQTSEYEIMNELMAVDGVDNVFGFGNFITVNKKMDATWETLVPKVKGIFEQYSY
ncbi:Scaffold protein Nfu/NifU [Pontibacillus halophilus JSM 076056 = DSM 19796]|uniref:Scaffold protein Nfu/NifU n=1 Tax=Pontibacillus halophilus JSM 076056 = DSM 19796 TaxID=1385510 RepID=A0A0A5GHC3_9BACI|nr:NifU N-terminal domain-containing protein [Pontibacillus halophilus]KGX92666.1 Scaffold protein Nfu/NifU [Pontibacillus halophilus JSM 076056 = DSM 19796]